MTDWFARPVLHVTEVEASLRFYVNRLGFTSPWRYEEDGRARVAQVERQGCVLILADTWPEKIGKGLMFISVNVEQETREAAIAALDAAGTKAGKVALFVGRMDMQNSIDRKQGIDETLGKVSGLEILPIFLDSADRTKAKKNIEDALARYPDLVLTVGLWSYNGPCLAGAIRESTRAQKPLIVAFDEEEETLKGIEEGLISATIVQKPFEFGYQSMKILKEAKDGKPVPATVDTGITTVDKSNLSTFWKELSELTK